MNRHLYDDDDDDNDVDDFYLYYISTILFISIVDLKINMIKTKEEESS